MRLSSKLFSGPGFAAVLLAASALATPAAGAAESGNLIVGGDAEAGTCSNDFKAVTTVPGWTVIEGSPSILCYAGAQLDTPKGTRPGSGFLADGPYGDSALLQTIDVSAAASEIDAGTVGYKLQGLLGGWSTYDGQAVVTAAFLDGNGNPLGDAAQIGGVTAQVRHDVSELLRRSATGAVPAGTRRIAVTLRFIDTAATFNDGFADNLSLTISAKVPHPRLAPPPSSVPRFDHVFLVMMENTDFSEVIGDTKDAPFINGLAASGTSLLNYSGVYHPSDENYLAIAGGNTFVEGAIYFPDIHVNSPHIGDELEAIGKTWRAYEQGMGFPCNLKNNFDRYYEPDDAPFVNFTDIQKDRRSCETHLVDTRQLAADLRNTANTPNFSWIAADDYFDGEASGNGSPKSLRTQDRWLKRTLTPIMNSAAWKTQRSLLILTWDESQSRPPNHIGTILVGSQGLVSLGTSTVSYNHYSTGRTIENALGIAPLTENDRYAQPINDAFGTAAPGRQ
ncbi:MAG: alkaline phosphatase family protein [Rhodospirillales bacterium]